MLCEQTGHSDGSGHPGLLHRLDDEAVAVALLTEFILLQRAGAAALVAETAHGSVEVKDNLGAMDALEFVLVLRLPEVLVRVVEGTEGELASCADADAFALVGFCPAIRNLTKGENP